MKTPLQNYSSQTHRLLVLSILVALGGLFLYFAWSPSLGGIIATIGGLGLIWSWLRR